MEPIINKINNITTEEINHTIELIKSDNYKERFRAEYFLLMWRTAKLSTLIGAINSGVVDFTPNCPVELLTEQLNAMYNYLIVLSKRAKIEHIDVDFEEEK